MIAQIWFKYNLSQKSLNKKYNDFIIIKKKWALWSNFWHIKQPLM